MNVTLTGSSGRVGVHVCRWLCGAGHAVAAVDRVVRGDLPVKTRVADLLDRESCYHVLEGTEALVHLANHPTSHLIDAQTVFNENVTINMNVFQAAMEMGVRKVVFASSIQAFLSRVRRAEPAGGYNLPYLPLDGDAPADPGNPYGLSKQASEVVLSYYAKVAGMSCVALRFPSVVDDSAVERLRKHGRSPAGPAEGFAWLHAGDAARLIDALLRADLPGFRIYFPAVSEPTPRAGSVADVVRELYPSVPLRKPVEQMASLVDLSRIERETGWSPQVTRIA